MSEEKNTAQQENIIYQPDVQVEGEQNEEPAEAPAAE